MSLIALGYIMKPLHNKCMNYYSVFNTCKKSYFYSERVWQTNMSSTDTVKAKLEL